MDLHALILSWPIAPPYILRPADAGTNNLTQYVDTPEGTFILRVYRNTADPVRIRYEHWVLTELQGAGLSFAVPAPVAARSGDTLVPLDGGRSVAALFRLIPGATAEGGNLAQARAAGAALGDVSRAMAALPRDGRPGALPRWGDLHTVHPLVPDPLELPAELFPQGDSRRARLTGLMGALLLKVAPLYETLPQQVIHGDFARGNTLLEGERVTGVLDFEFCSPDLRAIDFLAGLYTYVAGRWGTGEEWSLIDAFSQGFACRCPFTPAELEAIPLLFRLVRTASFIHWAGRTRQGLAAPEEQRRRAENLLQMLDWLDAHEGELVRRLRTA